MLSQLWVNSQDYNLSQYQLASTSMVCLAFHSAALICAAGA